MSLNAVIHIVCMHKLTILQQYRVRACICEVRAKSVSHVKKVCSSSFSLQFSSASSFISFSVSTSTNHSDSLKQTINNRLIPRKQWQNIYLFTISFERVRVRFFLRNHMFSPQAPTHCGYRYKYSYISHFQHWLVWTSYTYNNSRLYDFCCRGGQGKLSQWILSHVTSNPSVPYFLINNVFFSNMLFAMIIQTSYSNYSEVENQWK